MSLLARNQFPGDKNVEVQKSSNAMKLIGH